MAGLNLGYCSRRNRGVVVAGVLGLLASGLIGVAPAAVAATCDGVTVPCAIGDTGPGGGIVYYDAGSVKPWGRYLEAAPDLWDGGSNPPYMDPTSIGCEKWPAPKFPTKMTMGSGRKNTATVIKHCGQASAAYLAASYRGGGKDDWFLPSQAELLALYQSKGVVGSWEGAGDYWSSSGWAGSNGQSAHWVSFIDGTPGGGSYTNTGQYVRPVRAFPCTRPAKAKPTPANAACVPVGR